MKDTIIEILIDKSGSMGFMKGHKDEGDYLIDGQTRMSLIKKMLLDEIIPTIDYSAKISIRTFRIALKTKEGKLYNKNEEIESIYEGDFERNSIENAIKNLEDPPLGGTPIAEALNVSLNNLKKYTNWDRKIILLTDGEENGNGNYLETLKTLKETVGLSCQVFIIGIAQNDQAKKNVQKYATGGYFNLQSKDFEKEEIKKALKPLKTALLKDSIKNYQNNGSNLKEEKNKEEVLKNRIQDIEKEDSDLDQFIELEDEIKGYISKGEKLLKKFSNLKDSIRLHNLKNKEIDSTTLTIDSDYSEEIKGKSEKYIYKILCEKYGTEKVQWQNENEESFNHFDYIILDENKEILKYIDCKGTAKQKPTFYLTNLEWEFFLKNKNQYEIYRVSNLDSEPEFYHIENLMEEISSGNVVPYLSKPEVLKENRVFLTILKP